MVNYLQKLAVTSAYFLTYCRPIVVRYLWKHIYSGGEFRVVKTPVYYFLSYHMVIFFAVFLRVVATLE